MQKPDTSDSAQNTCTLYSFGPEAAPWQLLTHEQAPNGRHRLWVGTSPGDWVAYDGIACATLGGQRFMATTDYYQGVLPRVSLVQPLSQRKA